jgi:hypothetical protein
VPSVLQIESTGRLVRHKAQPQQTSGPLQGRDVYCSSQCPRQQSAACPRVRRARRARSSAYCHWQSESIMMPLAVVIGLPFASEIKYLPMHCTSQVPAAQSTDTRVRRRATSHFTGPKIEPKTKCLMSIQAHDRVASTLQEDQESSNFKHRDSAEASNSTHNHAAGALSHTQTWSLWTRCSCGKHTARTTGMPSMCHPGFLLES